VQINHFPIFDKNGKVCGTADIARDVSNLKNEHEKLQKNEYKYRMMIENQGDGVCILNDKNEFQFVNKACGNIFDCDSEDLIGKSIHEFLNKANKAKLKREIGLIEYNHTHSFELKIKLKKGKYKRILVMAASFTDDDPGNLLIFKDVTDQRNAEQELRQSEKKLKQLNATKDKFFSIIAHDLKNPFGSIMGFSNLILKKTDEQHFEKVADYARIIRKASADGFQLLENLLEWSRAQNGTLKHTPSNVLLNELIAHNIEICAGMAENKSISLKSHGNTNYHVFIDEDMINTVIRNLITNAIKFTPENKNIIISAQQKDEAFVAVSIADEGIGIDTSDMKKLFKIEHSHSTRGTQGEEGTGLGLLLCKEFVEKNGGKIWVEPATKVGSIFTFTLPLVQT
jgi:PAS domain S-box-containing protein